MIENKSEDDMYENYDTLDYAEIPSRSMAQLFVIACSLIVFGFIVGFAVARYTI